MLTKRQKIEEKNKKCSFLPRKLYTFAAIYSMILMRMSRYIILAIINT